MKINKIDKDGLLLCALQAKVFEQSLIKTDTSSEIFIRRFMFSKIARDMDSKGILETDLQAPDILDLVTEEYGDSEYGSVRYGSDELFWIGYIYRYYSYTHEKSSVQVYRVVKPKELKALYPSYHTLDPRQALDRILEAKNPDTESLYDIEKQYEVLKRIRSDF